MGMRKSTQRILTLLLLVPAILDNRVEETKGDEAYSFVWSYDEVEFLLKIKASQLLLSK